MSEPVNLNKVRKAKAKAEAGQRAKENRARFGRTKEKKAADEADAARKISDLDRKRLERGETQGDG